MGSFQFPDEMPPHEVNADGRISAHAGAALFEIAGYQGGATVGLSGGRRSWVSIDTTDCRSQNLLL